MAFCLAGGAPLAAAPAEPGASRTPQAAPNAKFEQLTGMVRKKVPEKVIQGVYAKDRPRLTPEQILKLREVGASDTLLLWLTDVPPEDPGSGRKAPEPPRPAGLGPRESARGLACGASKDEQSKVAMVVDPFRFEAFHTARLAIWGNEQQLQSMMRTLMSERLVAAQRFVIVEREQLGRIRSEQVINTSDEVKAGSGAQRGRFIGADVILQGTITVVNPESSNIVSKAGGIWNRIPGMPRVPDIAGQVRKHKVTVQLNYSVLDAQSSAVIRTASARAEAERMEYGGNAGGAGGSVQREGFRNSLVGEAAQKAMDLLARDLIEGASLVRNSTVRVEGAVAGAEGDLLVVNQGYADGLRACDSLTVYEAGDSIRDPKTGEVIDRSMKAIGSATVQQVGERTSRVSYKLDREPRTGDIFIRKER